MPYYQNGTWYNWSTYSNHIANAINNGTSDPISAMVSGAAQADVTLMTVFLGALYVFLWIRFANAPSRFKFVGMSALVFVISVIMVYGGFTGSAVLNFIVFIVAYFFSLLFKS